MTVIVTSHAAVRAQTRAGLSPTEVTREVEHALAERRVSRSRPAFLGCGPGAHGQGFWLWDSGRRIGFVVRPARQRHAKVVVTVLAAGGATAVAQAFARAQARVLA